MPLISLFSNRFKPVSNGFEPIRVTTPTPTPTPTQSTTPTLTPTLTLSNTPTLTVTPTLTPTPTNSNTPTLTPTPTQSNTPTLTPSSTQTSAVSSGLELYYDPSNTASYPGTGSTLYDLSPSGVNATISGNPTDNGNWFSFTGTQSIVTGNLAPLWSGWQHTLEIWVNPSINCSIFSDAGTGPTNTSYHSSGLEFYNVGPFTICNMMLWNGSSVIRVGGGTTPVNAWYQIVRVYNGSNTSYAYVNGIKSNPETTIAWSSPSPGWYLNFGSGDATAFSSNQRFQGKLGVIRVYNRVLTQSEITQNYNSDKSKYGL